MLSCVSQPKWGQPPVSAPLLARVPTLTAKLSHAASFASGVVTGITSSSAVSDASRTPNLAALSMSIMVPRLKNARAHPSSLRGLAAILKESPARGPRG